MLASFAAITATSVKECVSDIHELSGNPVKDCLEPVVTKVMQYLTDLTLSATGTLGSSNRDGGSEVDDGHLWYRAPDFERFKEDVIDEARRAGCQCPESQYNHIRSKYLDDVTLRNTALNLRRTSSDAAGPAEPSPASTRRASAPAVSPQPKTNNSSATAATTPTSKRCRKGHRRTVSWSKELSKTGPSEKPEPVVTSSQPDRCLSARDEAAQIFGEEDTPELKEIFL